MNGCVSPTDDANRQTEGRRVDPAALSDVLDDPHCRYVLECLASNDGPVAVGTLARHVAAGVSDSSPDEVPADVARRVQTWLHHGQLPELERRGVLEYDADASEVTLAANVRPPVRSGP